MYTFFWILLALWIVCGAAKKVYVTSERTCTSPSGCEGTISDPLDNLWAALNSPLTEAVEIILLYSEDFQHYLLTRDETVPSSPQTTNNIVTTTHDVTIRPLFCNDTEVDSNEMLQDRCVDPGSSITIYLKIESITWRVQRNLNLHNILFDGIENIAGFNPDSSNLPFCLYKREQCCVETQSNSIKYNDLICNPTNFTFTYSSAPTALFLLEKQGSNPLNVVFTNIFFKNLKFTTTNSLLKLAGFDSLTMNNVTIANSFLPDGIISSKDSSLISGNAEITLENLKIFSYNNFGFVPISPFSSACLLNSLNLPTNAVITISDSTFSLNSIIAQNTLMRQTSASILLKNSEIKDSTLMSSDSSLIIVSAGKLEIYSSSITNVSTQTSARFVYVDSGSEFNLIDSTFALNTISSSSAGYFIYANTSTQLTISRSSFSYNTFYGAFTALFAAGESVVTVSDTTFDNNDATAMQPSQLVSLGYAEDFPKEFRNVNFVNNQMFGNEDAIAFIQSESVLNNFTNILLDGNNATNYVYAFEGSGTLTDFKMWNNTFSSTSGFIVVLAEGFITLGKTIMSYNNILGGETYIRNSPYIMDNYEFSYNNLADGSTNFCCVEGTITNTLILRNNISTSARFLNSEDYYLYISNTTWDENIIWETNSIEGWISHYTYSNVTFKNNILLRRGALVQMSGGSQVDIVDAIIINNTLYSDTRLFTFSRETEISVKNTIIKENTIGGTACIFIFSCPTTITATLFIDNVMKEGGFLINTNSHTVTLDGVNMTQNKKISDTPSYTVQKGSQGLIVNSDNELTVKNSVFLRNTAILVQQKGTVVLESNYVEDLYPIAEQRRLFLLMGGKFNLTNFTLNQINNIPAENEQWIEVSNTAIFDGFKVNGFTGTNGKIFEGTNANLEIRNSKIGYIEWGRQAIIFNLVYGSLNLTNSTFEAGKLLMGSQMDRVKFEDVTVCSDRGSEFVVFVQDSAVIQMSKSTITQKGPKQAFTGENIIVLSDITSSVTMTSCTIQNTTTRRGALLFDMQSSWAEVIIQDSDFSNNVATASSGAAINVIDANNVNFIFNGVTFRNNTAHREKGFGGKGGAVYLSSQNATLVNVTYTFIDCRFTQNTADAFGGAIYAYGVLPTFVGINRFTNNQLQGGIENHIGSQAVKLIRTDSNTVIQNTYIPPIAVDRRLSDLGSDFSIGNVASGQRLPGDSAFNMTLIDAYGQVALDDDESTLQVYVDDEYADKRDRFYLSFEKKVAERGIFHIDDALYYLKPGDNIKLVFQTNGIPRFLNFGESVDDSVTGFLQFRFCQVGEIYGSRFSCTLCRKGSMQLNPNPDENTHCENCDLSTTSCDGGDKVGPRQGYWRMNETANIFLRCPIKEACLGATVDNEVIYPAGRCKENYQGNLCNDCITGFGKGRHDSTCFECNSNPTLYISILAVVAANVVLIFHSVKAVLTVSGENLTDENPHVRKITLYRMLINYVQVCALIGYIPVKWPGAFERVINLIEILTVARSDVFSFECLLSQYTGVLAKVYMKLILINLMPLFYIASAILILLIALKLRDEQFNREQFLLKFKITALIICFILQSSIVQSNLEMFRCTNLYRDDNPEYYLEIDYDTKCWTREHNLWAFLFALPCACFWMLILPGYVIRSMYKNKATLKTNKLFAFFTVGYPCARIYWEGIVMVRKYALIIVLVYAGLHDPYLQIYLALIIIAISFAINLKFGSLFDSKLNHFENMNLLRLAWMCLFGLYFEKVDYISGLKEIVLTMTILLGVVYFLGQWAYEILRKIKEPAKSLQAVQEKPPASGRESQRDHIHFSRLERADSYGSSSGRVTEENLERKETDNHLISSNIELGEIMGKQNDDQTEEVNFDQFSPDKTENIDQSLIEPGDRIANRKQSVITLGELDTSQLYSDNNRNNRE